MNNYHVIPIRTHASWFSRNRIFYFQLGKRPEYEALIEENIGEISRLAVANGWTFIFHKYLAENYGSSCTSTTDYEFLNEIASLDEHQFYNELEYQIFNHHVIDPVYIVRRYDEVSFLAWGYDAFRKGTEGLHFPFHALLPLDDVIGEHCQLDPVELIAKHGIYNLKSL